MEKRYNHCKQDLIEEIIQYLDDEGYLNLLSSDHEKLREKFNEMMESNYWQNFESDTY